MGQLWLGERDLPVGFRTNLVFQVLTTAQQMGKSSCGFDYYGELSNVDESLEQLRDGWRTVEEHRRSESPFPTDETDLRPDLTTSLCNLLKVTEVRVPRDHAHDFVGKIMEDCRSCCLEKVPRESGFRKASSESPACSRCKNR